MRIESVRFDASGNATIVVTGGISFFMPLSRVDDVMCAVPGFVAGEGSETGDEGRRAFLKWLPLLGTEFDQEDELYAVLASIDEEMRAKRKALDLCARAEQSSVGLEAKLAAKGFSRKAAKEAIASLAQARIVDDARYARIWARGREERRACGPALLAAELRSRGQGEDAIRAAIEEIDFSGVLARAAARERAKLAAAWRKKGLEPDRRFADELYRILKRQGFDPENIRDEFDNQERNHDF